MADDMVYPSGLTEKQAIEINEGLKWGTRIYGGIAVMAHVLAFMLTPWLR
ncbi:MAG: light-harvesting protein [Novosphingobium sp.]|jgi:light-harvesting protein B-800-850 beta chain|nr:light-harvesting protein [Novosphingobium sp.]